MKPCYVTPTRVSFSQRQNEVKNHFIKILTQKHIASHYTTGYTVCDCLLYNYVIAVHTTKHKIYTAIVLVKYTNKKCLWMHSCRTYRLILIIKVN